MPRFRFKPWMALAGLLALLVIFFATTFFIADQEERAAAGNGAVKGAVGSVAAPAVKGANSFASSVKEFVLRLFGARDVDKEYEQLKLRVMQLETANEILQDIQWENTRLRELLEYEVAFPDYDYIPARVIGREKGSWFFYFSLNRGSNDGVEKNMTVVNDKGLVGTVIEVTPGTCKVMAIIDRTSAISVVIENTRDQAMLHGASDPESNAALCELYYLPKESEVVPGSKVVTSDFDNISLKGIAVGTIGEVGRGGDTTATVIPYVDFAHLDYVLIIARAKEAEATASPNGEATAEPNGTATPSGGEPEDPSGGAQSTAPASSAGTQQGEPGNKGGEGN